MTESNHPDSDLAASFNLSEFLPYRLAVLSERVSRRVAIEYQQRHSLSVAEWRVLVHLNRGGTVSVRDIHLFANLEKSRVSRAVSRLEGAGLVQKAGAQGDHRLVAISLTSKGLSVLADILPAASEVERTLIAGLTQAELDALLNAMEKMHITLDNDPLARERSPLDTKG